MTMSQPLIQPYRETHRQLLQYTEGLQTEQWFWKSAPESWSITEVLTHLTDHHIVVSFRIRDILAHTTVQLPAFNQDAWVSGQKANRANPADVLDLFAALLHYNALLFERLDEEDWSKSGVNAQGVTVSISDIVQAFPKHVGQHLSQIERIKQAYANARHSSESVTPS